LILGFQNCEKYKTGGGKASFLFMKLIGERSGGKNLATDN
jgi:hypothetical protein